MKSQRFTAVLVLFPLVAYLFLCVGVLTTQSLRDFVDPSQKTLVFRGTRKNYSTENSKSTRTFTQPSNLQGPPPLLILHVGPRQTREAEIQEYATKHGDELEKDNFYLVGSEDDISWASIRKSCFLCQKEREIDCSLEWQKLGRALSEHRTQRHNVFLSMEWLSSFYKKDDAEDHLWQHLQPMLSQWRVRVVYIYRRFHDWFPRNYHQMHATNKSLEDWPSLMGKEIVPFSEAFDRQIELKMKQPMALVKQWKQRFSNVTVFNLHETGELIPNFFCKTIPEANSFCNFTVPLNETQAPLLHYLDERTFDIIAVGAHQQGLVDKPMSRRDVAKASKEYAEALRYQRYKDYPLTCLSQEQTDLLLNVSLSIEQKMLPDFYGTPLGENLLRFNFRKSQQMRLFCSVDVSQLLADERWVRFYKTLGTKDDFLLARQNSSLDPALPIDYADLEVNMTWFGIGAQGAGTTWLADILELCCPRIAFGVKKEMHFWDKYRQNGLQWYNSMFPNRSNHSLLHGEITPHYLALPDEDIQEIRALFPEAKILFLARDFVDRSWSHIRKGLRHHIRSGAIESADPADFTDVYIMKKVMDSSHRERSDYATGLQRWFDHFPENQILILNFDDIDNNPIGLVRTVTQFLGLSEEEVDMAAVRETASEHINSGAAVSPMRPSLEKKFHEEYRPYAIAFNNLLEEHGYEWRLNDYRNEPVDDTQSQKNGKN